MNEEIEEFGDAAEPMTTSTKVYTAVVAVSAAVAVFTLGKLVVDWSVVGVKALRARKATPEQD